MMRRALLAAVAALCVAPAQAAPALQAFDGARLEKIEAARRGKPFVLIVWSLDCTYCPAALAALDGARQAHGLEVVTLATDNLAQEGNAAQIAKKLGPRLARANAWAFADAPPEQLRYALDPKWRGETPRTYWYDAKGVRVGRSGPVTAQRIDDFVRQASR